MSLGFSFISDSCCLEAFIPDFYDTELGDMFSMNQCPSNVWEMFDKVQFRVCYDLKLVDFDYCDSHSGGRLRIVSEDFANLCKRFSVNFEFIPIEVRFRRIGDKKNKPKLEDYNVILRRKKYGLFFLKDMPIYAMDFNHSTFCIKRDTEGRAVINSEIPYGYELRYIYDYKVNLDAVKEKHLFSRAEHEHAIGLLGRDLICSSEFREQFSKMGLKSKHGFREFFERDRDDLHLWPELDPRCWILDKGEQTIFMQPEKPRPPKPKLP